MKALLLINSLEDSVLSTSKRETQWVTSWVPTLRSDDDEERENSSPNSSCKSRKRKRKERSAETETIDNQPKRLKGVLTTNDKGMLYLPTNEWFSLNDEEKAFIQKWNAAIKHELETKDIKPPEGVTIENKARRVGTSNIKEPKKRKRITFNLDDTIDENEDFE